jgi:hypothetical protein
MTRGFLTPDEDDRRNRSGDEPARKSDLVDLALHQHRETPAALLLSDDGDRSRAQWAPKSLIEASGGVFTMPSWLAREKGWL